MILENEYAPYFKQYLKFVALDNSIVTNLENSQKEFENLLRGIPEEKQTFVYKKGKWSVKEVVQHMIDSERIFAYRTLSFARKDTTALPGFDQDFFTNHSNANLRDFKDQRKEMSLLRESTLLLFKSFSEESLLISGVMSDKKITVRALGYLFSGHQNHHLKVLKERYL